MSFRTLFCAALALTSCHGPGPTIGVRHHDFQPAEIEQSAERVVLRGRVLRNCDSEPKPVVGLEVRLTEPGIEGPRAVATSDAEGYFELPTTESALDRGTLFVELAGKTKKVDGDWIAGKTVVLMDCDPLSFEVGASGFKAGDSIEIRSLRGTAPLLEPGALYIVEGAYHLGSADRATLAAYVTNGEVENQGNHIVVNKGHGTFRLEFTVKELGYPHVSFYPHPRGEVIGGIYFGEGDSLLHEARWLEKLAAGE